MSGNETQYREALRRCGERYLELAFELDGLRPFVIEYLDGCSALPVPKLCRWLGYIQGVLIERKITTVDAERDWTRPLFRPLDLPDSHPHIWVEGRVCTECGKFDRLYDGEGETL